MQCSLLSERARDLPTNLSDRAPARDLLNKCAKTLKLNSPILYQNVLANSQ